MLVQTSLLALAALLPSTLAQISDGFENGWNNNTWPIYAPDCNQGGTIVLDSTIAHTGKNSLKVTGGSSGYCGHIFFGTTAVPAGGNVFVRAWMRHTLPVGSNHVTFLTMPDSGLAGKHLRLSGQEGIFEYNRESDDATLPDLSPPGVNSSVGFPTSTWECLEYNLKSDGTIETWFNGNVVTGLTVGAGFTNANSNGWGTAYKPAITGVYFGWESYAGSVDTVWYDDIVIASSRVGCAVSGAPSATPVGPATSTGTPIPISTSTVQPTTVTTTSSSSVRTSTTMVTSTAKPTSTTTSSKVSVPATSATSGCQVVYVDV
ncbi:hypothetical protein LTR62_008567 [Meristemomyces frigidus]|uniref:Cip1-like core domain-containing protein n=1 Tax=Meristemomyces frigidus TaxID=1508187 RepID=A0AAN7YR65_9PEZI|nr:hypothetical protein LTR62_008567 [Meristemomyces frigidus]